MDIKDYVKKSYFFQLMNYKRKLPYTESRYYKFSKDEQAAMLRLCPFSGSKNKQLSTAFEMVNISIIPGKRFQSWIDTGLCVYNVYSMIDNQPPQYALILDNSINSLISRYSSADSFAGRSNVRILKTIDRYIDRVIDNISNMIKQNPDDSNLGATKKYFERMKNKKAESLEEAFQRIIFWSSIFWQTKHRLVGLGRLDKLLIKFCDGLDDNEIIKLIRDFYDEMHRYYAYKSNKVSIGDTGQIIVLGGIETDGRYFSNKLTYLFIDTLKRFKLPDPKILLRVSDNMPQNLLVLALECNATGIGSPLLSNDDIVIPALEKFGYVHEDACNYVTSACWEPLAYGKSLEKNNILDINFAKVFVNTYINDRFTECISFKDVVSLYIQELRTEISKIKDILAKKQWEQDPIMTLFTEGCIKSGKDISEGGAIYNNYGILSTGLANVVDSLFNIKKFVFDENKYGLDQLKDLALSNYNESEAGTIFLENKYFGYDEPEIIELINNIRNVVFEELRQFRNKFAGKVKFGFSSSNYAEEGKSTGATLDGRHANMPLAVHISAPRGVSIPELFEFAAKFDYSGYFSNGNVVDFFVTPKLISDNINKFAVFVKSAIELGFFQMQMNVVHSQTLLSAQKHPEKYPDLIVRVWGFSAYFNDLPENYQNVLIERALESESAV